MIKIYTDGACSGNPGPGGWGYVILENGKLHSGNGSESQTTNNRMELTAAIKALECARKMKSCICILTLLICRGGLLSG